MKRKATILGQVRDVEGGLWDVRQIRDTKYGFDLLFGSPDHHLGSYRGGLPRLIATQSLVDFWGANRTKRDGVLFDLPAGRTTLKRVRRRLGFHSLDDLSEFWRQHIEDLEALSAREFAVRHNVDIAVVFDTRTKLLGRRSPGGLVAQAQAAENPSFQHPAEGNGREAGHLNYPSQTPQGSSALETLV